MLVMMIHSGTLKWWWLNHQLDGILMGCVDELISCLPPGNSTWFAGKSMDIPPWYSHVFPFTNKKAHYEFPRTTFW